MAEERKVVTKKTASKKAVTKKTLARAPEPPAPPASTAASGTVTKKAVAKKAVAKKAPTAAKKVVAKKAPAPAPSQRVTPSTDLPPAQGPVTLEPASPVSDAERHRMIEEAAYYRAERRGFEPGHEEEDWTAATAEVDAMLREGR